MARGALAVVLAFGLLVNAFCLPPNSIRLRRDDTNNKLSDALETEQTSYTPSVYTPDPYDDDDDDDDFPEPTHTSSNGGGSNIFSLLKFAAALFPSSGGTNTLIRKVLQDLIGNNTRIKATFHRKDTNDIVMRHRPKRESSTPTSKLQRQENELSNVETSESESESSSSSDSGEENEVEEGLENNSDSDKNNAAEESIENNSVSSSSKQDSDSVIDSNESDEDSDSDERPGGDGQGGGILGLLAGLSGREDGESDLGTLLAAVSGIVLNLSGDGFDLNGIIASAVGLFAGLLSEGEENPGAVVASYLLTSLDTITGGGANNNGAFFGKFISRLVKGTSAAGNSEESLEEDSDENKMSMADSAGFFISFLMGLLGDMSKSSSGGSSS